ncbi:MAG: hypothetical protein KDI32_13860 [Pseudomonadales bacterium]|nr:hypothetical protein [Pseudomonadales bacterium]
MKILVIFLAVLTVALGTYSWRSRQAVHAAGERLTAELAQRKLLEQRLEQLEESLTTWATPAPLPPRNNPPPPAPPATASSVASDAVDAAATERRFVADILTNPQRRDAYMAQHRMIARLQYGEFIKRLDLSPADVDALVEILAQRQMAMLGRNLGVQPADPATMSRQVADLDAAEASDIAALLGADKAERFANYRSTLQERSILTPLVQELDLARKPLKPEQVDELARILKQETGAMREKMPIAPATFANGPNENQASRPSASAQRAYAKEVLDWQLELNQRIADRTAQLLTPEQQMRFVASQQQQIELQRLSMALIEPDTPAN